MRCRLCNRSLSLLQRLAKQDFCCAAHRREYARREEGLALERLMELQAPKPAAAGWCGFLPVSGWIEELKPRTGDLRPSRLKPVLWPELLEPFFSAPELPCDVQPEPAFRSEDARSAA